MFGRPPKWALTILQCIVHIAETQGTIMTALDDLKAADAKLGTSVAAAVSTLAADAAALAAAALKTSQNPDDSTDLVALTADLNNKAAALDAAVNPPPAS